MYHMSEEKIDKTDLQISRVLVHELICKFVLDFLAEQGYREARQGVRDIFSSYIQNGFLTVFPKI